MIPLKALKKILSLMEKFGIVVNILVAALIIVLLLYLIIANITQKESSTNNDSQIYNDITENVKLNNDIWEYGYIYLDHQSTSISVSIYQKDNTAPNDTQEMAAIFQKLTDYVYSWKDTHNGYNDYALEIFFHAKFAFYSSNYYFKLNHYRLKAVGSISG